MKNYIRTYLERKLGVEKLRNTVHAYQRAYAAAKVNRLTYSWSTLNASADSDIRSGLRALRGRSRDLVQNNDYARRFVKLCSANVVGPSGINFQSKVMDPTGQVDTVANTIIEAHWKEWGTAVNWLELQHIAIETVAADGEILVRFIRGKSAGNRFNFSIQLLEGDHLDETYSDEKNNIKMGIQYNDDGTVKGYWIWDRHPGDGNYEYSARIKRIFVPASEMFLLYYKERPSQTRGVPWMSSAMTRLNNVGGYEEAEIVAARVGASQIGVLTKPESGDGLDGEKETGTDNILIDAEPGTIQTVPFGTSLSTLDFKHPGGNFDPAMKAFLRGVASGLDVSYSALSGDLGEASYGSQRQGSLYERDHWMLKQAWFVEKYCRRIFAEWLDLFLLTGLTNLPYSKFSKFNAPLFQPRRWQWIDPLKDTQAGELAVKNMFKTRSEITAEQGRDFYEVGDRLAAEEAYIKKKGLVVPQVDKAIVQQENQNGTEDGNA